VEVRYYVTDAGRSQAVDFLARLQPRETAQIEADLRALAIHDLKAPISKKAVKGHSQMWELRTGGYRVLFVGHARAWWVLHICRKQDQRAGIEVAGRRMRELLKG
jgi:phage-related protein